MKKVAGMKKKKDSFQCCVCGENAEDSQMCCGHPMIELMTCNEIFNWDALLQLEKV